MIIKRVKIKNFRNISDIEFFPNEKVNIICGENAQGKTNILEALWLFSGAKSFRTGKDIYFLKFGEEKAFIEIDFLSGGCDNNIRIEFKENGKTAFLNNKRLKNVSLLAGNFNVFVFSPVDLSLIKDSPSVRRRFLDISIGQIYPKYIEILKSYTRAVIQRNKILKEYKYDKTLEIMFDVFEKEIAENGKKIINYREKYISLINNYFSSIYSGISSGKGKTEIKYVIKTKENIKEELKNSRQNDIFLGATTVGPHRDDLEFFINGMNVKNFGSQGQQRSIALSLKFASAEVIKEIKGEYPVCLLDDVLSELDPKRQNYILNHIKNWQVFLSCCDPANTNSLISGKIFNIKKGEIII